MPKSWHKEQKRLKLHRTKMERALKRQKAAKATSYGRMMARRSK